MLKKGKPDSGSILLHATVMTQCIFLPLFCLDVLVFCCFKMTDDCKVMKH